MWRPEQPGTSKKVKLRRELLHPRAVQSNAGGVLANGPYRVRVEVFRADLVYQEGKHELTIPVEFWQGGGCVVDIDAIRRWDSAAEAFAKDQIATIQRNILGALDHLRIRYLNVG